MRKFALVLGTALLLATSAIAQKATTPRKTRMKANGDAGRATGDLPRI